MRLHIRPIRAEQLLDAVNRQLLDHIDILTAAVVTLAGITFGILIGQHRTLRFHYARAGIVFGGNQLDVLFLTHHFLHHGLRKLIVVAGNGHVTVKHRLHLDFHSLLIRNTR